MSADLSHGIEELGGLIQWHVGVWHDLGYENPPTPECRPILPLGERSAEAIRGGHAAIEDIDELIRKLYALRQQLVGELRQDEDIRAVRVDAMLAESRARRELRAPADPPTSCNCPAADGAIRHQRATCTELIEAQPPAGPSPVPRG